jgi:large subunit ribosomal protein L35
MPKQKTHKGLLKRVKLTSSGKVKCRHSGTGHLMSGKNAKRRRRLSNSAVIKSAKAQVFKIGLCK